MSFSHNSKDIQISPKGILTASCIKFDGNYVNSSINLNNYISNEDGQLTWGGTGFIHNSNDIRIEENTLKAMCQKSDGGWVESSLNLDYFIGNDNGILEA
jgi:hypothetical protein